MAGITFSKSGHTPLALPVNPAYPGKVELVSGMATGLTEGGATYAYAKGRPGAMHLLRFVDLPAASFDGGFDYAALTQEAGTQSLAGWFVAAAPPGTKFTYADPFGVSRQVEFADTALSFELAGHGVYSGSIRLLETAG